MKKWTTLLMGAALSLVLAACGNNEAAEPSADATGGSAAANTTATTAPEASPSAAEPAEQESKGVPTLEELIEKTTAAGAELKSFSMNSQTQQKMIMKQGETSQEQASDITLNAKFTKDPLQMHQESVIKVAGAEQKVEQYITKDGIYTLTNGQWMKLPSSMTEQMTATLQQSSSPEKALAQFKSLGDNAKITEEGDIYLVTADVSGADVKNLAKSYLNQNSGADSQLGAMLDQMNIKSMSIVYGVDKKTYFPTKSDVNIVMDMSSGEQTISIDMKMTSTIGDHNKVEEIKVPQEALSAQEVAVPATTP